MKLFVINFIIVTTVYLGLYTLAIFRGAPTLESSEITVIEAVISSFIAILFFSYWLTMLIDCFKRKALRSRNGWLLGIVVLPWFLIPIYFFKVYRKNH